MPSGGTGGYRQAGIGKASLDISGLGARSLVRIERRVSGPRIFRPPPDFLVGIPPRKTHDIVMENIGPRRDPPGPGKHGFTASGPPWTK
jgi:hypothetical protein